MGRIFGKKLSEMAKKRGQTWFQSISQVSVNGLPSLNDDVSKNQVKLWSIECFAFLKCTNAEKSYTLHIKTPLKSKKKKAPNFKLEIDILEENYN